MSSQRPGTQGGTQSQRFVRSEPCETCRSTLWRRAGGRVVCSNGHIREMHVEESMEDEERHRHAGHAVSRKGGRKKNEETSKITPSTIPMVWLHLLRLQATALIEKKNFPREAYMAALWHAFIAYRACFKDNQWLKVTNAGKIRTWFHYDWTTNQTVKREDDVTTVSETPTAAETDPFAALEEVIQSQNVEPPQSSLLEEADPLESDPEENEVQVVEEMNEEEAEDVLRNGALDYALRREGWGTYATNRSPLRLSLRMTVAFLYYAAVYIRLPVLCSDFVAWVDDGTLPYRSVYPLVEYHFGAYFRQSAGLKRWFTDAQPMVTTALSGRTMHLARLFGQQLGMQTPSSNYVLLATRLIRAFALPLDLLVPVVHLIQKHHLLQLDGMLFRDVETNFHLGDARIIAAIVIVMRQLVDFHAIEASEELRDQYYAWLAGHERNIGPRFSLSGGYTRRAIGQEQPLFPGEAMYTRGGFHEVKTIARTYLSFFEMIALLAHKDVERETLERMITRMELHIAKATKLAL